WRRPAGALRRRRGPGGNMTRHDIGASAADAAATGTPAVPDPAPPAQHTADAQPKQETTVPEAKSLTPPLPITSAPPPPLTPSVTSASPAQTVSPVSPALQVSPDPSRPSWSAATADSSATGVTPAAFSATPVLSEQSREDTDAAWGDYPE